MARILVADDASFMRQMIREIVEAQGHEVVGEASDGDEVVEEFKRLHPDVVTMDIVMPRRSGIDAVKSIIEIDRKRAHRDVQRARSGVAGEGGARRPVRRTSS